MTDPAGPTNIPLDFEVEIEGVAFTALIKAAQTFHQLAGEVAGQVVGGKGLVQWVVTGAVTGSVDFKMRPMRTSRGIPQRAADEIPAVIVSGMEALDTGPTRPTFFTPRAIELARALGDMVGKDLPRVTLRHGTRVAPISKRLAANAARVLIGDEDPYREYGTVEGRLEAFNVHTARVFSIWDAMTGQRIPCDFGYRIPSREIGAAAERRVVVSGEIFYDLDGNIERVDAHSIEVMPEEEDLPSVEDVLGILADG